MQDWSLRNFNDSIVETKSWYRSQSSFGYHSNSYSWMGKERTQPFGQMPRVFIGKRTKLGFSEGLLTSELKFSFFDGQVNVLSYQSTCVLWASGLHAKPVNWKKVEDKGLGAPCRKKTLEKSGLEPAAPNRLADRKHCALSTHPNPHLPRKGKSSRSHVKWRWNLTLRLFQNYYKRKKKH